MMRVHSQAFPTAAPLAALTLLMAVGCASTAIDTDEPSGSEPGDGNQGSAGSSSAPAPVTGPDYQKQDYPAGPYGVGIGSTIEDFAFLGWKDPVAANYDLTRLETVRLSAFYNPDGRSNTKLIWINASAVWCSVCRAEMKDVKQSAVKATYAPQGLQMVETLFEDNDFGPAKPLDLQKWGQFVDHSIDFPLLLDPGFKLGAFFTSDATPLNLLIDASTMRIVDATMGWSADYWSRVGEHLSTL